MAVPVLIICPGVSELMFLLRASLPQHNVRAEGGEPVWAVRETSSASTCGRR